MIKIVVIGLIGTLATVTLKKIDSNLSFLTAIITGVIIISLLYIDLQGLIDILKTFSKSYGIDDSYVKLLLKVLGISFISQFGISVAEDCGEKLIAQKIEFASKVFIITLSVPILINLLDAILNII